MLPQAEAHEREGFPTLARGASAAAGYTVVRIRCCLDG